MDFQLLQYNAWESKQLMTHSALLEKYKSLKQKESMLAEAKDGKTSRKDILLKHKADNTISKIGNAELELIEKEDTIDSNYNRNINTITSSRESSLKTIEDKYEADLLNLRTAYEAKKAMVEEKFSKAESYYNSEKESSKAKSKREFDSKKRTLEARGECIQQERAISVKSATEITLEKQKFDILKQLKNIISQIEMSRSSLPPNTPFNTIVPTLPEPLGSSPAAPSPPAPAAPSPASSFASPVPVSNEMPAWLANMGEDASLAIMREEARREAAEDRKMAREAEEDRQEKALAYKRQLEEEAEERKRRNDEYRRNEKPESDDDMTDEQIQEYIAKKKSVKQASAVQKSIPAC